MRLEDFDRIYETCESQVRSELITTPSNLNDTTLLMCLPHSAQTVGSFHAALCGTASRCTSCGQFPCCTVWHSLTSCGQFPCCTVWLCLTVHKLWTVPMLHCVALPHSAQAVDSSHVALCGTPSQCTSCGQFPCCTVWLCLTVHKLWTVPMPHCVTQAMDSSLAGQCHVWQCHTVHVSLNIN